MVFSSTGCCLSVYCSASHSKFAPHTYDGDCSVYSPLYVDDMPQNIYEPYQTRMKQDNHYTTQNEMMAENMICLAAEHFYQPIDEDLYVDMETLQHLMTEKEDLYNKIVFKVVLDSKVIYIYSISFSSVLSYFSTY